MLILPAAAAASYIASEYSCNTPGKISAVGCWLDGSGFVTGVAFEDDYGVKSPAMCSCQGPPDVFEPLGNNSIVGIVACE